MMKYEKGDRKKEDQDGRRVRKKEAEEKW